MRIPKICRYCGGKIIKSKTHVLYGKGNETIYLCKRVCRNKVLMETARYLGRLKELIQGKRKSGYAYGRGEKYSVELGGDINRALGSEFAMLAAPETLPLFLRKLQRKGMKQYQRREPICKGSGDIICMLDESGSTEDAAPWCKAVALALLDIAIQGKRRFAMIHFSSAGRFQTDLFLPGEFDRENVLKAAETAVAAMRLAAIVWGADSDASAQDTSDGNRSSGWAISG